MAGVSKTRPYKAVIYCRVSGAKQVREGDGLVSQENRCREYATYKDFDVVEVFKDGSETPNNCVGQETRRIG